MNTANKTSRRDFLSASAASTTALTAGLSLSRSAHAAGTERFNIALIGSGGRGTGAAADCLRFPLADLGDTIPSPRQLNGALPAGSREVVLLVLE